MRAEVAEWKHQLVKAQRCITAMRSMTEINQELISMVPAQALVKTSTSANKENVAKETSANDADTDHVSLKSIKVSSVEYLTVQEFDK